MFEYLRASARYGKAVRLSESGHSREAVDVVQSAFALLERRTAYYEKNPLAFSLLVMLSSLMGTISPAGDFSSVEEPILRKALALWERFASGLRETPPFSQWEPWARRRMEVLERSASASPAQNIPRTSQ